MNLSPHFTLAELTLSQTAARQGIDNTPPAEVVAALRETAAVLERVRRLLGDRPIVVTSGFRCLALNRAIGSLDSSAHVLGRAADFTCPAFGPPLEVARTIAQSDIAFDQLIHEFGSWVHIAQTPGLPRRQLLTIDGAGTRYGLE